MAPVSRTKGHELLLGEWACLGILYPAPAHGFAIAARLKPGGDIGRVWSLTRPLTYRALDQLAGRGYVEAIGEERGIAGGTRTILAATRSGRTQLRKWLNTPVVHLRDLRSELLLKLVLAAECGVEVATMLEAQQARVAELSATLDAAATANPGDAVAIWRSESAHAALRVLERLGR